MSPRREVLPQRSGDVVVAAADLRADEVVGVFFGVRRRQLLQLGRPERERLVAASDGAKAQRLVVGEPLFERVLTILECVRHIRLPVGAELVPPDCASGTRRPVGHPAGGFLGLSSYHNLRRTAKPRSRRDPNSSRWSAKAAPPRPHPEVATAPTPLRTKAPAAARRLELSCELAIGLRRTPEMTHMVVWLSVVGAEVICCLVL